MIRTKEATPFNILLVEDNPHDRVAFVRTMKQDCEAHTIEVCECAEDALQLIEKEYSDFDVAIVDHHLPGQSGLAMCRELLSRNSELPVIILTGHGSERLAVEALKAGVDDYIVKEGAGGYLELLPIVVSDVVSARRQRLARLRVEKKMAQREWLMSQIIEQSTIPTFVIDKEHKVTHWNRACSELTGISHEEALNSNDQWRAFYPEKRPVMADLIVEEGLETNLDNFYSGKYRASRLVEGAYEAVDYFRSMGGEGRWVYFTAAPLCDEQGAILGSIETLQDITEQKKLEQSLQDSERLLQQIIDRVSVATFVIDQQHRVIHWNNACAALTGHDSEEMVGTVNQWRAFYPEQRPVMADLVLDQALESGVAEYYAGKYRRSNLLDDAYEAEDFFPHMGERGRWLYFTAATLRDSEGRITGAIETLQDITEQKIAEEGLRQSEKKFRELSIIDGLTGLYNTRHFYDQLTSEIERSERYTSPLSLLLLDVDKFKQINDRYGHLMGDEVLVGLADVIRHCLRHVDTAYRYGGEEFVVLMPSTERDEALIAAERLRRRFCEHPVPNGSDEVISCSVSIGVAEYSVGEEMQQFIQRADKALYRAKDRGRNRVEFAS